MEALLLEDKKTALAGLFRGFPSSPIQSTFFLSLSDIRWTLVRSGKPYNVLGQNGCRNPVRTEDLDAVAPGLASLVSFSLTEREAELVVEIVSPLIVAQQFFTVQN